MSLPLRTPALVAVASFCATLAPAQPPRPPAGPNGWPAPFPPAAAPALPAAHPQVPQPGAWSRELWIRQTERQSVPVFVRLSARAPATFTFYGKEAAPIPVPNRVALGLRSRNRYLFRIDNLGGVAKEPYYGSVEVLRGPRLKPGMAAAEAPAPIQVTDQDEDAILRGGMVTKVVVLERPDRAVPTAAAPGETFVYDGDLSKPVVKQAEHHGRPLLVVRIGDRVPMAAELAGDPEAVLLPTDAALEALRSGRKPKPEDYVTAARSPSGIEQVSFNRRRGQACNGCGDAQCGAACGGCDPKRGGCGQRGCGQCGGLRGKPAAPPQLQYPPVAPWALGFTPMPAPPKPQGKHELLPDDELLCDGGDRGLKAHHDAYGRLVNLDAGDTALEYRDALGKPRVKPSTVACVYAPRYVEVRFLQGLEAVERLQGAAVEARLLPALNVHGHRGVDTGVRIDGVEDLTARNRASAVAGRIGVADFSEIRFLAAVDVTTVFRAVRNSTGTQQVKSGVRPQTAEMRIGAKALLGERHAQLYATGLGFGEVLSTTIAATSRTVEPGPTKPAKAVVEKTVDVEAAEPGDEVVFTIRCKNQGTEPLLNAALVDQLPARLEYLPKSAVATRETVFSAELNEFGSHTLRWELKGPLAGGQEFEVKFKCRVR